MTAASPLAGVYVIILNWNGAEDTAQCLASLQLAREAGASLLVVDNGSTDGSEDRLTRQFPDVQILQTGRNLGYTGGNNAGLAAAIQAGAQYLCVLNNDTTAATNFLPALMARATESSHDVALSPVIRYASRDGIWFAGGTVDEETGLGRHLQRGEFDPDARSAYGTDLLTGCCLFAPTPVWQRVGLFDDRFFLNFEDTQWSLRARLEGIQLEVVPQSVIHHKVSASFRGPSATLGSFYYARNGLTLQREHLKHRAHARRFVWRHVLQPALRSLRRREEGAAARLSVALLGLACVPLRTYGPAPRWVQIIAKLSYRSSSARSH